MQCTTQLWTNRSRVIHSLRHDFTFLNANNGQFFPIVSLSWFIFCYWYNPIPHLEHNHLLTTHIIDWPMSAWMWCVYSHNLIINIMLDNHQCHLEWHGLHKQTLWDDLSEINRTCFVFMKHLSSIKFPLLIAKQVLPIFRYYFKQRPRTSALWKGCVGVLVIFSCAYI